MPKFLLKLAAPLSKRGVRYVYGRSSFMSLSGTHVTKVTSSSGRTLTSYRRGGPSMGRQGGERIVEGTGARGKTYGWPTGSRFYHATPSSVGRLSRVLRSSTPRSQQFLRQSFIDNGRTRP